jgi:RNA polymerase sigma factor (sigma-70 family)
MHATRDREDARLLQEGQHARLVATYLPVVRARIVARRYPTHDAEELVSRVMERLWRELHAGRIYPVPYRVVVHQVVSWTCADFHRGEDLPLEDWDAPTDDEALRRAEERMSLTQMFSGLPPRERELAELVYGDGWAIEDAAERLGITRNAADQALWRARRRLREHWHG